LIGGIKEMEKRNEIISWKEHEVCVVEHIVLEEM
jgi:hypothetical protein